MFRLNAKMEHYLPQIKQAQHFKHLADQAEITMV